MGREQKEKTKEPGCQRMSENEKQTDWKSLSEEAGRGGKEWREAIPKPGSKKESRSSTNGSATGEHGWNRMWPSNVPRAPGKARATPPQPFVRRVEGRCANRGSGVLRSNVVEEARSPRSANASAKQRDGPLRPRMPGPSGSLDAVCPCRRAVRSPAGRAGPSLDGAATDGSGRQEV